MLTAISLGVVMKTAKWADTVGARKSTLVAKVAIAGWSDAGGTYANFKTDTSRPLSPCLDEAYSLHREKCAPCQCAGVTAKPSCGALRLQKLTALLESQARRVPTHEIVWRVRIAGWPGGDAFGLRLRNGHLVEDVTSAGRQVAAYASRPAAKLAAEALAGVLGYTPLVERVTVRADVAAIQATMFK